MTGIPPDIWNKTEDEIKQLMLDAVAPESPIYIVGSDILKMRHTERLIRMTCWVAFATWFLSIATILTLFIDKYIIKAL
jgi:hypothetical protein